MTELETQRWSLWLHWCECSAVFNCLRTMIRFAQQAEEPVVWREALATQTHIQAQWQAFHDRLWALDPVWSADVLGHRTPPRLGCP